VAVAFACFKLLFQCTKSANRNTQNNNYFSSKREKEKSERRKKICKLKSNGTAAVKVF
jgi:hypothetical protein